jgi:hypothetical protein
MLTDKAIIQAKPKAKRYRLLHFHTSWPKDFAPRHPLVLLFFLHLKHIGHIRLGPAGSADK